MSGRAECVNDISFQQMVTLYLRSNFCYSQSINARYFKHLHSETFSSMTHEKRTALLFEQREVILFLSSELLSRSSYKVRDLKSL